MLLRAFDDGHEPGYVFDLVQGDGFVGVTSLRPCCRGRVAYLKLDDKVLSCIYGIREAQTYVNSEGPIGAVFWATYRISPSGEKDVNREV